MKNYQKTLMQIDHRVSLSQVGACASCYAVKFHGTKDYAKAEVAKHRAISREVRNDIASLIKLLDQYDRWVEQAHSEVVAIRFGSDNTTSV